MIYTARFVRKMITERGYTPYSVAFAIGVNPRTVRRWVSLGRDFRAPDHRSMLAIKGLPQKKGPPVRRPSRPIASRSSVD